jgi:hypothetical protein
MERVDGTGWVADGRLGPTAMVLEMVAKLSPEVRMMALGLKP